MIVSVSILSCDEKEYESAVRIVDRSGAEMLHLDVMDGIFVVDTTYGAEMAVRLRPLTALPFDAHLMVRDPAAVLEDFIAAGADRIALHCEAAGPLPALLRRIREAGCAAGIALSPGTAVEMIEPLLPSVDFVLVMTVHPGKSSQPFISAMLDKIIKLRKIIDTRKLPVKIQADGGIGPDNIAELAAAGLDIAVSGSAVMNSNNPAEVVRKLQIVN
ncbi:MAG: ribulose-phosphate 3-epimerase [Oscillospiraceae bacterium]|nr:ribulose-phosphate 3-epimerase [Oscillospiraceae bacterium]